ncbi:MAG: DUF4293 domain-containing protein [Flavobacteriaceae bacterium]|nr:DUF4293 domain-containing protein [Flavobacteriaceae bacterium]
MIQRIQSLYLLLTAILSGLLVIYVDLWQQSDGTILNVLNSFEYNPSISVSFFSSSLLAIVAIFLFNKRKLQFVIGRIIILINFYLLGLFIYLLLTLPGEMQISQKGIGFFIPLVVVVLTSLANKAIRRDEKLVKSVDRIR